MANLSEFGLINWEYKDPPTYESLWFEKVDGNELRYWTRKQVPNVVIICGFYLLFVWLGPLLMRDRKPFNLKIPLVLWNAFLAIFSIFGAARIYPEFFGLLLGPNGFHRSACDMVELHHPTTFWGFAYTVSKIVEFGDTVFIVLRKRPLIFLHWYHHLSMAWITFNMYPEGEPFGRWVGALNYSVHSIMYFYYAIKALNIKVPKRISMVVTSLQIGQFLMGLAVNMYTAYYIGNDCYRTSFSVNLTLVTGITYLSLFVKLFYQSYIAEPKVKNN